MEANEVSHSVFVPVSPRSKHHLTLHRPVHATAATEEPLKNRKHDLVESESSLCPQVLQITED